MNEFDLNITENIFFIGIAGDGMSAIAQYLKGAGKTVSGSDRQFSEGAKIPSQIQLENEGIVCFPQDTSGITDSIDLVVVSTAIEPTVPEYKKALEMNIPVIMRSDLLAAISQTKKTIAVAGTSGKSTVTAMIWHILEQNGTNPSLITGAGLIDIQKTGKRGNAVYGTGEYLVIEADESDGSLIKYKPEIGLILNIDKDHKELDELNDLFQQFAKQSNHLIVNQSQSRTKELSQDSINDFGYKECGFIIYQFKKDGFSIDFRINNADFYLDHPGKHSAENAAAAAAAASLCGIDLIDSSKALKNYSGIYRRHQIIAKNMGITIIDDYAHNPAKLAASIRSCQLENRRLLVWFQPHGFKPTKFLKDEFIQKISESLRKNDHIYMSEIYYAGGTVSKDISAGDLIDGIRSKAKNAYYIPNRTDMFSVLKSIVKNGDVILLTGARDPSLSEFAQDLKQKIVEQ